MPNVSPNLPEKLPAAIRRGNVDDISDPDFTQAPYRCMRRKITAAMLEAVRFARVNSFRITSEWLAGGAAPLAAVAAMPDKLLGVLCATRAAGTLGCSTCKKKSGYTYVVLPRTRSKRTSFNVQRHVT